MDTTFGLVLNRGGSGKDKGREWQSLEILEWFVSELMIRNEQFLHCINYLVAPVQCCHLWASVELGLYPADVVFEKWCISQIFLVFWLLIYYFSSVLYNFFSIYIPYPFVQWLIYYISDPPPDVADLEKFCAKLLIPFVNIHPNFMCI